MTAPTREPIPLRARPARQFRARRARLAIEIVSAYARAHRELRRAPIAQVVEALRDRALVANAQSADQLTEAKKLAWGVSRTLALTPGDTRCLVRSLVLSRVLARRGIASRLVIGARSGPDFLAHAWVECGGVPVLPTGGGSFGRLVEL
jgi:hypothetical protein